MTSKERARLKGLAMNIDPIFSIGKTGITPEFTEAIAAAIKKREIIKINVLKNNDDDLNYLANTLAERTHSQVVQVIGRKIVLYKFNPDLHKEKKEPAKNSKSKSSKASGDKAKSSSKKAENGTTKSGYVYSKKKKKGVHKGKGSDSAKNRREGLS